MNPYDALPGAAPSALPEGENAEWTDWTVGDLLGRAWERFRTQWAVLSWSAFVAMLIVTVPVMAVVLWNMAGTFGTGKPPTPSPYTTAITQVTSVFTTAALNPILARIGLDAARGQPITLSRTADALRHYLTFLSFAAILGAPGMFISAAAFLLDVRTDGVTPITFMQYGLGLFGFLINGLGLMAAPWFMLEKGLGPVDAMAAALQSSEGYRGRFLLLSFVFTVASGLGVCACFVGTYVAMALTYVGYALAWDTSFRPAWERSVGGAAVG